MKGTLFLLLFLIFINTSISQDSMRCTSNVTVTYVKSGDVFQAYNGNNSNETIKLRNIEIIKPDLARQFLNLTILNYNICLECDGKDSLNQLLCDAYTIMPKNSISHESVNKGLIYFGFARLKSESYGDNTEGPNYTEIYDPFKHNAHSVTHSPQVIHKTEVPVKILNNSPSVG